MSGFTNGERLEPLGSSFVYDFADKLDERAFRKAQLRRFRVWWTACLLFAVVLYGGFISYVASTVATFATVPLGMFFVVAIATMFFGGRFIKLRVDLQADQISVTHQLVSVIGTTRLLTDRIKAANVSSLHWVDDGCWLETGQWYSHSRFIDKRLLLQPGAVELIREWASQNKIEQTSTPPSS